METRILLVRHGETDWNTAGLVQGRTDLPLNARGREQAREVAHALVGRGVTRVISSPLLRATQTAEVIAAALGSGGVETDDGLVEQSFGLAEGLRWEDATARHPDGVPGLEERPSVVARAGAALARWAEPGTTIAVVTHRGVINALRLSVGERPDTVTPWFGNASIHELVLVDGRLQRSAPSPAARPADDQSGEPSGPVPVPSGTVRTSRSSSRPLPPDTSSVSTGPTPET